MNERGRGGGSAGRGEREVLIEAATTAWRPRGPSAELRPHPAWADLDPAARVDAHDRTRQLRALEAALHPDSLSTTARAVLARIRG